MGFYRIALMQFWISGGSLSAPEARRVQHSRWLWTANDSAALANRLTGNRGLSRTGGTITGFGTLSATVRIETTG